MNKIYFKTCKDIHINIYDIDHDPLSYVAVSEVLVTPKALESLEVRIYLDPKAYRFCNLHEL